MRTRELVRLLAAAVLTLASCSYSGPSQAIGRLTATEAAAVELARSALGPEAMIPAWERHEDSSSLSLFCEACRKIWSFAVLDGPYAQGVLELFDAAAAELGAHAGPIERLATQEWMDGVLIREDFRGLNRVVSFRGPLYVLDLRWEASTGALHMSIETEAFEPSP
jgi:hypothetical protein